MEKCLGYLVLNDKMKYQLLILLRIVVLSMTAYLAVLGQFALIDIAYILVAHWVWYMIGLEVGYHKLLSHRSFKTTELIKNILATVGTMLGHPTVLEWVFLHRTHHALSDKEGDPHSPWIPKPRGFFSYVFRTYFNTQNMSSYEYKNDQYLQFLHQNQILIHWVVLLLSLLLFNATTVLIVWAIPSIISPYCLGIANYYTHQGKFNGYDHAQNFYWVELIAPGMGFHGNHHNDAGDWCLAKKYKWADISSLVVKLIKR